MIFWALLGILIGMVIERSRRECIADRTLMDIFEDLSDNKAWNEHETVRRAHYKAFVHLKSAGRLK